MAARIRSTKTHERARNRSPVILSVKTVHATDCYSLRLCDFAALRFKVFRVAAINLSRRVSMSAVFDVMPGFGFFYGVALRQLQILLGHGYESLVVLV